MPSSTARATARSLSAALPRTIKPPSAPQPKPSTESLTPVLPSIRCSIAAPLAVWTMRAGSGAGPALHRIRLPAPQRALLQHRRIDAAHRPAAAQHQRQFLTDPPLARGIETSGSGGDMRGEDNVVHAEQRIVAARRLLFQDVEPGAGDPALLQRLDQRRLVDSRPAPRVDEERATLHQTELLFLQEVLGVGGRRRMH